jgi:multidrug resistance efflux pump
MIMKHLLSRAGFLRLSLGLILVLGLIGGGLAFFWGGGHDNQANAGTGAEDDEGAAAEHVAISVKVVRPHFDNSYAMFERRPADVHAYYESPLVTRVTGPISMIQVAPGAEVKKGNTLIEVSVPDRVARVAQRKADVERAIAQVAQMEAAIEVAEAEFKAAKSKVKSTAAKLRSDQAYQKFRERQYKRYEQLLAARSIDAKLVDEQEDHLTAAIEAVNASTETWETAKIQRDAAEVRIDKAKADRDAAKAEVKVAKAELDHSQAMLDYAKIKAPYDGTITERNVDPGFFVQDAGSGRATPLLTIQRSDIVTVVVRVPDNFAPFVTTGTEAIFETADLPGVKIRGKITRFPPSLKSDKNDRTLPVEIDLWNGSAEAFEKVKNDEAFRDGLKAGPLPIVLQGEVAGGAKLASGAQLPGGRELHLLPGTFGYVTLVLRNFNNIYMLPSESIVTQGGYTYIYVVRDGKAHLQPVKVQVDDGKLVKVARLDENGKVAGDLTGKEEVIVSNLGELNEGQLVEPTLVKDWGTLDAKKEKH